MECKLATGSIKYLQSFQFILKDRHSSRQLLISKC